MRTGRVLAALLVVSVSLLACSCGREVDLGGYRWGLECEIPEGSHLWDVVATDASHAWAVGSDADGNGVIFAFDGRAWSRQRSVPGILNAVAARDDEHVWAAGDRILFYDGEDWREQHDPPETIADLAMTDSRHVWAADLDGGLYLFDGSTWRKQLDVNRPIVSIDSTGGGTLVAADETGDLLFYDGSRWESKVRGKGEPVLQIAATGEDDVWFVGAEKWTYYMRGPGIGYDFGGFVGFYNGAYLRKQLHTGESLYSVSAADPAHVWAAGSRSVYFFDGNRWKKQYSLESDIHFVFALDDEQVWVVGGRRVYQGTRAR